MAAAIASSVRSTTGRGSQWRHTSSRSPRQAKRGWSRISTAGTRAAPGTASARPRNVSIPRSAPTEVLARSVAPAGVTLRVYDSSSSGRGVAGALRATMTRSATRAGSGGESSRPVAAATRRRRRPAASVSRASRTPSTVIEKAESSMSAPAPKVSAAGTGTSVWAGTRVEVTIPGFGVPGNPGWAASGAVESSRARQATRRRIGGAFARKIFGLRRSGVTARRPGLHGVPGAAARRR